MTHEALEDLIPHDLHDAFNTLSLGDEDSFRADLEDAAVLAELEYGPMLIRFCTRGATGEPMVLLEGPGDVRITFLPGQA